MAERTVRVRVGSVLFDYTGGCDEVEASGRTLRELIADLDRRYPGIGFRVVDEQGRLRPHMNVFVGQRACRDLGAELGAAEAVHVLGALSGG